MRCVMRYVLNNGSLNNLDESERCLLKECVDANYIEGIELTHVASGSIKGQIKHGIRLTRAGVEFLSKNNEVEKSERTRSDERGDKAEQKKRWIAENYWIPFLVLIIGGLILEFLVRLIW